MGKTAGVFRRRRTQPAHSAGFKQSSPPPNDSGEAPDPGRKPRKDRAKNPASPSNLLYDFCHLCGCGELVDFQDSMDKILSDFEGEAYAFPMGKNFELHFPIQPRKKQRALLWRKKTPPYSLRLQINVSIIDRLCGDLSNFIIKSKSQIIRFNERGIEFSPAFAHPVRSEKEFELKWRIGMGITGKIVYHASKFPATIQIVYKNHTANAKDAIEVLALNDDAYSDPSNPPKELGLKAGSRIKLVIQGPDADAVMGELTELFTCDDP